MSGCYTLSAPVLLDICHNLLVRDEELGVLRFAHFSVQEFLLRQFDVEGDHASLAEVCLTTLLAPAVVDGFESALMGYATFNWAEHVRLAGESKPVTDLCTKFLDESCLAYKKWLDAVTENDADPTHKLEYYLASGAQNSPRYHSRSRPQNQRPLAPLLVACYYKLVSLVRILIGKGNNLNSTNLYGHTAQHLVVIGVNVELTRLLLKVEGVDKNRKDKDGQTPLSYAAENGHETLVRILCEKGVEMDSQDTRCGRSALSWAAVHGHEEVVKILLESGVNVECKDTKYGRTPLFWAVDRGHQRVIRRLLENGADVECKDRGSRTPLAWAAFNGLQHVVEILLANGADVHSKDSDGRTPLAWAAGNGHEEVLKILLEKGVDVDSKDNDGHTASSWAADRGHGGVVKILRDYGPDPN